MRLLVDAAGEEYLQRIRIMRTRPDLARCREAGQWPVPHPQDGHMVQGSVAFAESPAGSARARPRRLGFAWGSRRALPRAAQGLTSTEGTAQPWRGQL
jgi:hypothetical protein